MAVDEDASVQMGVNLVDPQTKMERSFTIPVGLVVPTSITITNGEPDKMPTLLATERIIDRINHAGFALVDENGQYEIARFINTHYIPVPSSDWQPHQLDLGALAMASEEDRTVGYFVETMREPILPGAIQYLSTQNSEETDALPSLAQTVYQETKTALQPQRHTWNLHAPRIGKFIGKCALDGIVSTLFGVPVMHLLDSIFE